MSERKKNEAKEKGGVSTKDEKTKKGNDAKEKDRVKARDEKTTNDPIDTKHQENSIQEDTTSNKRTLSDSNNQDLPKSIINEPLVKEVKIPRSFVELWFDDPVEGEAAQKLALELRERIELKALPIRTFLEEAIVPLLLQGLQHMVLERPTNPAEYLAAFLLKNNPLKDEKFIEPTPDPPVQEPMATQTMPPCSCCQLHCPPQTNENVPHYLRSSRS